MSPTGGGDTVVRARRTLLDALEALGALRVAVILIGAQAIYLHTGDAPVAIAPFTVDADIQLDPRVLPSAPLIEDAMKAADFTMNLVTRQPGAWVSIEGVPVDLMVAAAQTDGESRRAHLPPHDRNVARRAPGLEGGLVDHAELQIPSLEPEADDRVFVVRVAGPAALLMAKAHKLGERAEKSPHRLRDKDAHDVYRLLRGCSTQELAGGFTHILDEPLAAAAAREALTYLDVLFARGPSAPGAVMAGRAEEGVGTPLTVAASSSFLAGELLTAVRARQGGG